MTVQIDDLIGKHYAIGARGPDAYDCWGLVLELVRRAGGKLPDYDTAGLSRTGIIRLAQSSIGEHAGTTEPRPNTVVLDDKRGHAGVTFDGQHVIHTTHTHGVVVVRANAFQFFYQHARFYPWQ